MEEKQTIFQKFMGVVNKIGSAIMLNLLFLVSCIPVVTIGNATAGLYSAVRFSIRGDSTFQGFREGFKKNFLRVAVAMVLCMAMGYFTINNATLRISALLQDPSLIGVGSILETAIHCLFALAVILFTTAMIPVNVYFDTDANGWIMDAWYLALHAPLQVLATALILWLPVILFVWFPLWAFLAMLIFIAVYYAVMGVVITVLLKNTLIKILNCHKEEEQ